MLFNRDIRRARPNLIDAAPLTFWLCVGYAIFNLILGEVIYQIPDTSHLAVYNLLSQHIIGVAFGALGLSLLISLATNSWRSVRISLGFGLFIKALYAYSLIELGITVGFKHIDGVLTIWMMLVWVQFFMIVYFAPPFINGNGGKRD